MTNPTSPFRQSRDDGDVLTYLPDRSPVIVRPIRADDKRLLSVGLGNLSPESVHRRFLAPKTRFSRSELRYLTEVDGNRHAAFVAESPVQPSRHMIGVARFVRDHEDPESAEAAIVVADDWQGRGLGSLLARHLAETAHAVGVRRFTATMLAENKPALRLMEKLAHHLEQRPSSYGATEAVADLAA